PPRGWDRSPGHRASTVCPYCADPGVWGRASRSERRRARDPAPRREPDSRRDCRTRSRQSSDLEELGFLLRKQLIDVVDLALRQVVEFGDGTGDFVLAGFSVLLVPLDDVLCVVVDVS